MSAGTAVVLIAAFATLTLALRHPRLPRTAADLGLAASGALAGVGALMLQDHVLTAEWIGTPVVLAVIFFLHARALFAGNGPLRT